VQLARRAGKAALVHHGQQKLDLVKSKRVHDLLISR
jgi:hypothetical protein